MAKSKEEADREKYFLWFEYFKRSETFRRYKKYWKLPHERLLSVGLKENAGDKGFYEFAKWHSIMVDFDGFLNYKKKKMLIDDVTDDFQKMVEYFYFPGARKGVSKTKIDLPWIADNIYGDALLRIKGFLNYSVDEAVAHVRKIISERKKSLSSRLDRPFLRVNEGMRFGEVRRYLEIFDRIECLKKRKYSWDKIVRDFYPRLSQTIEDDDASTGKIDRTLRRLGAHERRLKLEYSKAKRIIRNTESGQFPGKYNFPSKF